MKSELFIPEKIKVGYQRRSDTYNGSLAYIIYFDKKGVLRKEKSWESWRDNKISPQEFENKPTEGFVLNKKAGGKAGSSSSWNIRNEAIRVYDPRGFEFEISVPNLLFILQETSCVQGKGLEGEFVYSWEGTELVLLPVCSQEYKLSSGYTELQDKKVSSKDLKEGCSYKTKKQEDLIYLGKFNWYSFDTVKRKEEDEHGVLRRRYDRKATKLDKQYIFLQNNGEYRLLSSLTSLAFENSNIPVSNYAELMDNFSNHKYISKPVSFKEEPLAISWKDLESKKNMWKSYTEVYGFIKVREGIFNRVHLYKDISSDYSSGSHKYIIRGYRLVVDYNTILINENGLKANYQHLSSDILMTKEEIEAMGLINLIVVSENGSENEFNKY